MSVTAEKKHIFTFSYTYHLSFEHGKFKWEIARSYNEIKEVHKKLVELVESELGHSFVDISPHDMRSEWPKFPTDGDHLIGLSVLEIRCEMIKDYLEKILTYPPFRDHPSVLNLVNVSPYSFVTELGSSIFEGRVQKRTGDNVYYGNLLKFRLCCDVAKIVYTHRWFIIKDSCIIYLNEKKGHSVGYVMLVDRSFEVKMKHRPGAYHAIVLKNSQRTIVLKCSSSNNQQHWYDRIIYMLHEGGKSFWDKNSLRYDSFAPQRSNQLCKWYINGSQYMEHVMNALNKAREEIFITDWWICPELYLKRPKNDLQYRLDKILLKKSKEGVKVYVLIFKEVSLVVNLWSTRAKQILSQNGKNPNIKVLRHPEHSPSGVMLWSHHEKMVVIDQSLAFMGGIDLCYGRWDDDLHRLVDLGRKENVTEIISIKKEENVPILDVVNIDFNIINRFTYFVYLKRDNFRI